VKVVKAESMDVPAIMEYSASLQAKDSVYIRARVQGYLQERHFEEGSMVEPGQLLFTIDPSEYEESLKEARAQLKRNQATLGQARTELDRFKRLVDQGAVSRDEYDQRRTTVEEDAATVASQEAAVKQAELNLGYTKVMAPIAGRIGRAQAQVGDLVGKGENTLLATISGVDPIYANFSISEQDYLRHVKVAMETPDQEDDARIILVLQDGTVYNHEGKVDMVDPTLDQKTGTLGVRAVFPNQWGILRPGQYGRIRVAAQRPSKSFLIPQRAIMDAQGMQTCLVVAAKDAGTTNTISSKVVKKGQDIGSLTVILEGLEAGDLVLLEGQQKLRAGSVIDPRIEPLDLTPLHQLLGDSPTAAAPADTNATQTTGDGQQ
jgi:membrane fusion protein, multidrug efflux system